MALALSGAQGGLSVRDLISIFHELERVGITPQAAMQTMQRIYGGAGRVFREFQSQFSDMLQRNEDAFNNIAGGRDAPRNAFQPAGQDTAEMGNHGPGRRFPPGTPTQTIIDSMRTSPPSSTPQGNLPCLTKVKLKLRLSVKMNQVPRVGLQLVVKVMRRK